LLDRGLVLVIVFLPAEARNETAQGSELFRVGLLIAFLGRVFFVTVLLLRTF
jgi:hypothetical protein